MPEPFEPTGAVRLGSGLGGPHPELEDPIVRAEEAVASAAEVEGLVRRQRRSIWRQFGFGFWLAVAVCSVWIILAVFANVLPLDNPNIAVYNASSPAYCGQSLGHMYSAHWLGCDFNGRDILSRIVYGSRVSLEVGFGSIAIGLIVGGVLGIIAGYFRGWIDEVLSVISNVFLSFPYLVLALVIVTYLGNSLSDIIAIIAILAWPLLFRVVRAATIEYSQREYVLAAQALGSKPSRILRTLLLPDVVPSAITYALLGVPLAIVAEGALSYLGESIPPPTATWGNMIQQGTTYVVQDPILLLAPAIAMFSFILPINFIGDRLRSVLDSRQGVI